MKTEDRLAREATERLLAPESPTFFDDLWVRLEADARARAGRRRRLGIAAIAATAAVVAVAGVYAAPAIFLAGQGTSSTLDRTYSCGVKARPTLPTVDVAATVTLPTLVAGVPRPASATVTTDVTKVGTTSFVPQIFFGALKNSLVVDKASCRPSSRHVALKAGGLPAGETVTPDFVGSFSYRCVTAKHVLVRIRLVLKGGIPTRGLIAVRNDGARRGPVAFVEWSPRRITPFLTRSCVSVQ